MKKKLFDLSGKVAAITGAGSGIGRAIAHLFSRQGARVLILDNNLQSANETAKKIRGNAETFSCDVSNASQVEQVFSNPSFKNLNILVNNAGISHIGKIDGTSEHDMDRIYSVNVKGLFHCTKAGIKIMLKNGGGVILNLGSLASLIGLEDRFAYTMSKGAVLAMTKSIAIDYIKKNIRCNCICPARIHTPFVDEYLSKYYRGKEKEMFRKLSEYQPIGRMGTPEEVAALALYLCSDEALFVTGQAYPIDGGVLMQ